MLRAQSATEDYIRVILLAGRIRSIVSASMNYSLFSACRYDNEYSIGQYTDV